MKTSLLPTPTMPLWHTRALYTLFTVISSIGNVHLKCNKRIDELAKQLEELTKYSLNRYDYDYRSA
ncbi:hypothetical protein SAMN04488028_103235 [Reichenbachiella agariperforans]|uniref:Uncharacterized protein n=1 Tax=Reichenbachiella agariperforans TaxID=156994 RepID=A0A1M6Q9N1_REIAG|nr:hypothetical protein SAMN04488028_103235 [Reichenbachiella agariperforans]